MPLQQEWIIKDKLAFYSCSIHFSLDVHWIIFFRFYSLLKLPLGVFLKPLLVLGFVIDFHFTLHLIFGLLPHSSKVFTFT
jgi:hypothetical protein